MSVEERQLRERKAEHIRRLKRWMRPLPRRTNIHRYPILSLFAKQAKKRAYLWSFNVEHAVPAIYAGFILTLLPLYGLQLVLCIFLALILKANLPLLAGLQIISNPITVWPIWFAAYQIGRNVLSVVGIETDQLKLAQVREMLYSFTHARWDEGLENLAIVFGVTSLGSVVMGVFFGLIGSTIYRIVSIRSAASYALLVQKLGELRKNNPEKPLKKNSNA
ncbi:MAG: DUF2062 domain-containing protein [Verrucomicrobiota bacterium]